MRRARGSIRRTAGAAVGLVLAGAALSACANEDGPADVVAAFLAGWRGGDLSSVGFVAPTGEKLPAARVLEQIRALSGELKRQPPALTPVGEPKETGDIAELRVDVDWTLPGDAHWRYPTVVRLSKGPGEQGWRVIWEPSVVHERLTDGDALAVGRVPGPRAAILDAAGQPIVQRRPVVVVGVQPSQVTDVKGLVRTLTTAFRSVNAPVDLSGLPGQLAQAKPDAFVEVVTLRRPDYLAIRSSIQPLPGTVFREEERDLAPTRAFARALLGTVDPVQKDDMAAEPGVYEMGDLVGHGGLQGGYEDRLRGTPGQRVTITSTAPDGAEQQTEIYRAQPRPGAPVRTTLDQRTQLAADEALRGQRRRSALVAVRVADGAVLATANGPDGGGENMAFTAQVPPGSTFKMVSTLGLLDAGAVRPDAPVACPKTFTVEGRSFKNSDNMALGTVPFRTDFARSCNTAFAALAPKLGADGLAKAGATLGLGTTWDLGVDAFAGRVSAGGSAAERAAAAFGQGTTVVSPLAMAAATAGVANGHWRQPRLIAEPAPDKPAPDGPPLAAASAQALRQLMREVVTVGTATALRDTPGGPVYGKTGTAEYDNNPAHTHAWFVGWQGTVAFAVFVERGGSSGATAVPIAERFLRALAKP